MMTQQMNNTAQLFLPPRYRQQVEAILAEHIPEADVWAYGSRVNGDHYDASDLDLVVHFPSNQPRDPFKLASLREAFSESNLPIIVQLVDWDRIPQAFKNEILVRYAVVQCFNPTATGSEINEAFNVRSATCSTEF
jgi:predicted nucleotidyltransferase